MRYEESIKEGNRAEDIFAKSFKSKGYTVNSSTVSEDMTKHIDYYIKKDVWDQFLSVDVKAMKRSHRHSSKVDLDWIWVEFKNVNGKRGWLYGEQDCVAFERPDDYLMVCRDSLASLCEELVNFESRVYQANEAEYSIYTRYGRRDIISKIKMSDIETLKHGIIPKIVL